MKNKRKYFGTDGIRGKANSNKMNASLALNIGMATAEYFTRGNHKHFVLIGKDTRLSNYTIEPSLTAGFLSMGMNVYLTGPLPTPGVSVLVSSMRCDVGVMISASHNHYSDNGIKIFGPDGTKLSDQDELKIEKLIDSKFKNLVKSENLGRAKRIEDAGGRYIEYLKSKISSKLRLDGLKIVIDCANGAAYKVAPKILWELGATVIPINISPDGRTVIIGWMRTGKKSVFVDNNMPFNQQMSFPCKMELKTTLDGIRLFRWPIKEIESLYHRTNLYRKNKLSTINKKLAKNRYELIDLYGSFNPKKVNNFEINIRGHIL